MSPIATAPVPVASLDPRTAAYCSPVGPEVFSGVVHGNQIWASDPFDIETIHAEARAAFAQLLERASSRDAPSHGKTLLLLGEAGSGKTHLMRAFRTMAHARGQGYCGYMQMTARTDSYARYLLSNLIDSLEQPYKPGHPETGLQRLAWGLLDSLDLIPEEERRRLRDDLLEPAELAQMVNRFANAAVQYPRFCGIDINVIRALLYTLPNDGRIHPRILNWLRCDDLNRFDRELIGDLVPRPQPEMPLKTVLDLGRLMYAVHGAALVLLIDQLEELIDIDWHTESRGEQFRAAIGTAIDVADGLPTAVVVIGCLEDLFKKGAAFLAHPKMDRLKQDPPEMRLAAGRTDDEVRDILSRRLQVFFEAVGIELDPTNPVAPYSLGDVARMGGLRTRSILERCLKHRAACIASKALVHFDDGPPLPPPVPPPVTFEQRWNEFLAAYKAALIDDEPRLAELLAFVVRNVSEEMPDGVHFGAEADGRFVPVDAHTGGNAVEKLYVAVCDRNARGGGLGRQVEEAAKVAGEIPAVFVRSTAFPSSPTADVSKLLATLIAPRGKGRRVVIENSDWRAMAAFRDFHARHHTEPGFADWRRIDGPLAKLRAVSTILALDKLLAHAAKASTVPPSPVPPPLPPEGLPKQFAKSSVSQVPPAPPVVPRPVDTSVRLGQTRGAIPAPLALSAQSLCRHAAFLGGPGSGKTTAALTLVEQLLVAGVPVVLVDRKGDLSRYADPDAWTSPQPTPERAARRARLQAAVDVALYTPGADSGRPLTIPIAPSDFGQLSGTDRENLARFAATSLSVMIGHKGKNAAPKLVVLQKAIEVVAQSADAIVTVKLLQKLIGDQDEALVDQFEGQYEGRLFRELAQELLTLSIKHRQLLEGGEPLDVDALLGRGPHGTPGKTRLAIINTQFLGDPGATDFWVSQFLLAVDRWRAKNPAPEGSLQAVFVFDEADLYLPALRQPATKGPMEGLLKRARSAGIGLFLATQSPGDFDYKCRDQVLTWLIGRVKEPTAIAKLKPMLEARADAAGKLAGQTVGQFFLVRESDVSSIHVERNLIPTEQLPEDRILAIARSQRPK